jgi:hypothetical protein
MPGKKTAALIIYSKKIRPPRQSVAPQGLHRKAGAALGAAAPDNRAAGSRTHAETEAVRAFTADLARLVCSFHNTSPSGIEQDSL